MDVLTLLDHARAAGLTVRAEGDKLVIRGPKRAESLARELGARKAEVLRALASEPAEPPLATGDRVWLERPGGGYANVLAPWRIDHVVDSPDGPLAIFLGRPYASWPLAFCRRASEVRYPPARPSAE